MNPKEFIEQKLNKLKISSVDKIPDNANVVDFIYQNLTSKKFRKYSLTQEYQEHIKNVIRLSIQENSPVRFSLPFGGNKLWRLEETPEVDWAELFTLMYYAKWLKPICEIYKPGIIFDFASDDVIIERMNNIPKTDTEKYKESFKNLVKFLEKFLPNNLKFTYTQIGSFYSEEEFEKDLNERIREKEIQFGGLPLLDEAKAKAVELNVKLKKDQGKDPLWKEKVELLHQAYYAVSKRRPYTKASNKILAFPYPLSDGRCISIGTTKTSIAKFWAGIGALKRKSDGFVEYVLSPTQIANTKLTKEKIHIKGLEGKNFQEIKIF